MITIFMNSNWRINYRKIRVGVQSMIKPYLYETGHSFLFIFLLLKNNTLEKNNTPHPPVSVILDPENVSKLTFFGMTVVETRFLNRPILGSMSSEKISKFNWSNANQSTGSQIMTL